MMYSSTNFLLLGLILARYQEGVQTWQVRAPPHLAERGCFVQTDPDPTPNPDSTPNTSPNWMHQRCLCRTFSSRGISLLKLKRDSTRWSNPNPAPIPNPQA